MENTLTKAQAKMYSLIKGYWRENKKPPTITELQKLYGAKYRNGAVSLVKALLAKEQIQEGEVVYNPYTPKGKDSAFVRELKLPGDTTFSRPLLKKENNVSDVEIPAKEKGSSCCASVAQPGEEPRRGFFATILHALFGIK